MAIGSASGPRGVGRVTGRWFARGGLLVTCAIVAAVPRGVAAPPGGTSGARIEPIASLDSLLLMEPGAWAPQGSQLLLGSAPDGRGPTRLYRFDAARPEDGVRLVYESREWIRTCAWSPDGGWVLVVAGNPNQNNVLTVLAVPADGGRAERVVGGEAAWPAVWGPDGRIHYRVNGRWRDRPAPAAWRPAAGFVPRPAQTAERGVGLALRFRPLRPGGREDLLATGLYFNSAPGFQVRDRLPDGSRSLVAISDGARSATRMVDGGGTTLLDLQRAGTGFQATAISGDGRVILGYAGEGTGEEGWGRTWLEAADGSGGWRVRVEGGEGGAAPQLSREDSYIAFRAAKGTTVARLVVEPR